MRKPRSPHGGAERIPGTLVLPVAPSLFWLWVRRLVLAAALAVTIGYLPYRVYVRSGLARYLTLQAELSQLREKNRQLQKDNHHLRIELDRLANDEEAIERVARDELGLIRPGEMVFKVGATAAASPAVVPRP